MKKFNQLWYYGLSIIGIPVILVIMAIFSVIVSNLNKPMDKVIEEEEKPKVDTVIVEKRVIVRDTVYIKPKINPRPGPIPSKQPFKTPEPAKADAADVIKRLNNLI